MNDEATIYVSLPIPRISRLPMRVSVATPAALRQAMLRHAKARATNSPERIDDQAFAIRDAVLFQKAPRFCGNEVASAPILVVKRGAGQYVRTGDDMKLV